MNPSNPHACIKSASIPLVIVLDSLCGQTSGKRCSYHLCFLISYGFPDPLRSPNISSQYTALPRSTETRDDHISLTLLTFYFHLWIARTLKTVDAFMQVCIPSWVSSTFLPSIPVFSVSLSPFAP